MRKKKFSFGRWIAAVVLVVLLGGGYWLSLERKAPSQKTETPVELKLQPVQ